MDNGTQELRLFEHEGGPLIQVEINLEEAPLFMLQRNEEEGEESIEARNTVITREGHRIEQYWRVTAHRDFGLPGAVDEHVFIAIMQLVERRGGMPPDGRLTFTLYELLGILGKSHGGKNYEELRESLDRLSETSIYAENAFYSIEDEDFKSHRFHLWDVTFRKRKRKGRASEHHTLKFSDVLVRSFNAGYLKSLDANFYNSLGRDLARSLYRLIDAKRKKRLSWSVELQQLRQMVSMPPSYRYASKIKERLIPAHRELTERGYLDLARIEERGKGREKQHVVHYRVSPKFVRERADPTADLSESQRYAVDSLTAHGVWPETAREMVLEHGPDHCLYYVELLPYQKDVRNRAAWLRRYVENGWPVRMPEQATLPVPERQPGPEGRTNGAPRISQEADPRARELFEELVGDLPAPGEDDPRVWFDGGLATALEDETLILTLPNAEARDFVESRFRGPLEEALRRRLSGRARVEVVCPAPPTADREARDLEFRRRRAAGEFDRAVRTFETLPYGEYRKWVGQTLLHPDGNHYHLALSGKLYACVGGTSPEHRHHLSTLKRAAEPSPRPEGQDPPTAEETPRDESTADPAADAAWRSLLESFLASQEHGGLDTARFGSYSGYSLEAGVLVVRAPDRASADEIVERFGEQFGDLWRGRVGEDARVFVGPPDECARAVAALRSSNEGTRAPKRRSNPDKALPENGGPPE